MSATVIRVHSGSGPGGSSRVTYSCWSSMGSWLGRRVFARQRSMNRFVSILANHAGTLRTSGGNATHGAHERVVHEVISVRRVAAQPLRAALEPRPCLGERGA